jgi:AcrR family transcriptional regulator
MAVAKKRAGRPTGATGEETQARLLDAARRFFSELGYSQASNQQIARAAGITSGSLYHYFESKAELFAAVYRDVLGALLEAYTSAAAEHDSCVEQLCEGLERVIALSRERPGLVEFVAAAISEIPRHEELESRLLEEHLELFAFFHRLLEDGQRRGEIAPEVDLEAAVGTIVACTSGLALQRRALVNEDEFAALMRGFQQLIRGHFFAPPS